MSTLSQSFDAIFDAVLAFHIDCFAIHHCIRLSAAICLPENVYPMIGLQVLLDPCSVNPESAVCGGCRYRPKPDHGHASQRCGAARQTGHPCIVQR